MAPPKQKERRWKSALLINGHTLTRGPKCAPPALLPNRAAQVESYFFTAAPEPLEAGTELSLFTTDFFVPFLWLFLVVVFAALFGAVAELCAAGLAGAAAV